MNSLGRCQQQNDRRAKTRDRAAERLIDCQADDARQDHRGSHDVELRERNAVTHRYEVQSDDERDQALRIAEVDDDIRGNEKADTLTEGAP